MKLLVLQMLQYKPAGENINFVPSTAAKPNPAFEPHALIASLICNGANQNLSKLN